METKRCPRCSTEKPLDEFPKHGTKAHCYCKNCFNEYYRNHRHTKKYGTPYTPDDMKKSPVWLGYYVAQRALGKIFDNIQMMPLKNPGFDIICGRGYKIEVKASCLYHYKKNKGNLLPWRHWYFTIHKNRVADYFLLLAFGERENLEPLHVWLIPANELREKTGVSITDSHRSLSKWTKYERPIDKVVTCCSAMRDEIHA